MVPSAKISIKSPRESEIGQLISFIQSTIYYLCLMLNVNWASNPKVVVGKKICNEALQKKISIDERKNIREKISKKSFKEFYF